MKKIPYYEAEALLKNIERALTSLKTEILDGKPHELFTVEDDKYRYTFIDIDDVEIEIKLSALNIYVNRLLTTTYNYTIKE